MTTALDHFDTEPCYLCGADLSQGEECDAYEHDLHERERRSERELLEQHAVLPELPRWKRLRERRKRMGGYRRALMRARREAHRRRFDPRSVVVMCDGADDSMVAWGGEDREELRRFGGRHIDDASHWPVLEDHDDDIPF